MAPWLLPAVGFGLKTIGGFLTGKSKEKAAKRAAKGQNEAQRRAWANSENKRLAGLKSLQAAAAARGVPFTADASSFDVRPNPGVDMTTQLPSFGSLPGSLLSGAGDLGLSYAQMQQLKELYGGTPEMAGPPGSDIVGSAIPGPTSPGQPTGGSWNFIEELLRQLEEGRNRQKGYPVPMQAPGE